MRESTRKGGPPAPVSAAVLTAIFLLISLFLAGRYVRDRSLSHALNEAYRGLLMVGRNPVAFLNLEIPPEEVDVNVHPTKIEVRFRDPQRIYSHLLSTLRQTFLASDLQGSAAAHARAGVRP